MLISLYENNPINKIFVHQYGSTYEDVIYSAVIGRPAYYDLSEDSDNYLQQYIGWTYMCGFGIWNLPDAYYSLLLDFQTNWLYTYNIIMPVFVIEREPIMGGFGLIIGEGGFGGILRECGLHDSYCFFDN